MATAAKQSNDTPINPINSLFSGVKQGSGSLADLYVPVQGKYSYINITKDFPWTLSNNAKDNAPRIILKEYAVNESTIKRQALAYGTGAVNAVSNNDPLTVYKDLYPKDTPTGFVYDMPYFDDINFEVNTPPWTSLDTIENVKGIASGISRLLGGKKAAEITDTTIDTLGNLGGAALASAYPKVGITDRPRLWDSHERRSIVVKFPLFNTYGPDDWIQNRQLCELLVNQNLYNKRDFITSVPPVFYELLVVGQHYSYASCVTNLTIRNRGNMRILTDDNGKWYNVPDVYEINITLLDMVMPSKNMFQAINNQPVTVNTKGQTQLSIAQSEFNLQGNNLVQEGIKRAADFLKKK